MTINKKNYKASMTVEAAFVLPVFIYAIVIFLYFFQILFLQQTIQAALHETAKFYTKNAYLYEKIYNGYIDGQAEEEKELLEFVGLEDAISSCVYKVSFDHYVGKKVINNSIITGGLKGIRIQPQADYFDDDYVDLCAYYECNPPILFFHIEPYQCVQRIRAKNWTGQGASKLYGKVKKPEEEEKKEEFVYKTKYGTVYHTHLDCKHLSLSIRPTNYASVGYERNRNNEKYTRCDKCAKNAHLSSSNILYITDEGDRYHTSKGCPGLSRYIKELPVKDIPPGMNCCRKCAKREEIKE